MAWLRFERQLDLVCTEDPARNSDVLGTDSSMQCRKMVEIETKISIADLRKETDKVSYSRLVIEKKHERLAKALAKERVHYKNTYSSEDKDMVHGVAWADLDHSCLPSQFYFLVPVDIAPKAELTVKELFPHAGLMIGRPSIRGTRQVGYIEVIKTAPVIHRLLIPKGIKSQISARMASEICKLRLDIIRTKWSTKDNGG
jgi:hypothetical protein